MKEVITSLKPYVPEEAQELVKARLGVDRLVRLSANENPYGTSSHVREAVVEYVTHNDANLYPDGNASELRKALSVKWQIPENQFVIGVGLDEVISMVSRVFLTKGDEVLVSNPAFSEYALNGKIEGAKIVSVPCFPNTGHFDINGLIDAASPHTKLVWLCNPNNPTGTYESVDDLLKVIVAMPNDALIVIDEAYIDFVTDVDVPTAIHLLDEYDNVAIMRTFSKAYGLANYRVGYMVMSAKLANYVQTIRLPYNLNTVSQVAALAALKDEDFLAQVVRDNKEERDKWEEFLQSQGINFYHSQANFIFMEYEDAEGLADAWLAKGYQVRRGFRPNWLRVGIGRPEDCLAMQMIMMEYIKS